MKQSKQFLEKQLLNIQEIILDVSIKYNWKFRMTLFLVNSADPKLDPTAIKYDEISYDKIIADNLKALDLTAVAMCKEFALTVVVVGKDEPNAIIRVLNGEKLGTIIK